MEHSQSAIARTHEVMTQDGRNGVLYNALKKEQISEVVELCGSRDIYRDGPLHVLTIHGDTVLHMAAYTVQADLVIQLLEMLKEDERSKLTIQNAVKNTILHEAAAFNKLVPAAQKMLEMAPQLLKMRNIYKDTALFRAARYGKIEMFAFLDRQVRESCNSEKECITTFYQKPSDSTILHAAVISGHFKLALRIAKRYDYLVDERDDFGMTALQHLARNSLAFHGRKAGYLKGLIYKCVSEDSTPAIREGADHATGWRVPLWEEIQKEKLTYELAKELANFLVKKDITSWKNTKLVEQSSQYLPITEVEEGEGETQNDGIGPSPAPIKETKEIKINEEKPPEKKKKSPVNPEPPLFLATKAGCVDIVEEILHLYPQAVEFVDVDGCTLLHIAIKYRQTEIFHKVEQMKSSVRKLIQKTDKDGNSILHMVGEKTEYTIEQMKLTEERDKNSDSNDQSEVRDNKEEITLKETNVNLVLQLQEDLVLFERVKKICSQHFFNHVNSKGQTAEQLFALKSEKLHTEAKEWLKRTSENSSIVAVLIATVAFAAAYTVPGGSNDQTGVPILLNKPLFVIFTVTDVLSLTCTLTSLVIFLSILTSAFRLRDFKNSLPQKLMLGFTFLLLSVSMMMMSFAATIALMIHNKEQWTKIALYTVAFLPVTVFVFSYMPLYLSSLKTFKYVIEKLEPVFPRYSGFKTKIFSFIGKFKKKVPAKPTLHGV